MDKKRTEAPSYPSDRPMKRIKSHVQDVNAAWRLFDVTEHDFGRDSFDCNDSVHDDDDEEWTFDGSNMYSYAISECMNQPVAENPSLQNMVRGHMNVYSK